MNPGSRLMVNILGTRSTIYSSVIVEYLSLFIYFSEGDLASEPWQQTYGKHSGNEIYHIQLCNSRIFGQFEGKKFTDASVEAHEK